MKVWTIVAWVLVAILAIGLGVVAFLGHQQATAAAELSESLATLQADWDTSQSELDDVKNTLAAAQGDVSAAQAESASQAQKAQEQTARVDTLAKDLAAKDEELAAAKTAAEAAAEQVQSAQAAAEAEQQKWAQAQADFEAQLAAAQAELATLQAAVAPELEAEDWEEAGDALVADEVDEAAEAAKEVAAEREEVGGQIIGQSEMFSFIRYDADQSLYFRLLDGQTLVYQDVPASLMNKLVAADDRVDMRYRFHIQGKYKSLPPDNIVIRKFWKWQRRHQAKVDVRALIAAPSAPTAEVPGEE